MKNLVDGKTILLFYKQYEADRYFRYDRYLQRVLRPFYHRLKKGHKISGFLMWHRLLVKALLQQGYDVRINDYALAKKNPAYPVGLVGYPILLDNWSLPNPALLGPALYDHPKIAPGLMNDPRYRLYLVTCQWMEDVFKPYYHARCAQWYAGIDPEDWPDTSQDHKEYDVLVYDKIRWNRERYVPGLLEPVLAHLESCGLRYTIVRYMQYDHATYKKLLGESKTMLFLCEHETQGMAYQEALASNLPILAWENGFWLDPNRHRLKVGPTPATSVPYFSPECGERFTDLEDFPQAFERFWGRRDGYQPRQYVQKELSLAGSARLYSKYYFEIAREQGN